LWKTYCAHYFQGWIKVNTAFILQVVILFAFLSFALTAIDIIMFCGQNSLVNTLTGRQAGCNVNANFMDLIDKKGAVQQFLRNKANVGDGGLLLNTIGAAGNTGAVNIGGIAQDIQKRINDAQDAGALAVVGGVNGNRIDWVKLLGLNLNKAQGQVLAMSLMGAIMVFLFLQMLEYIPILAMDLSGSLAVAGASRGIVDGAYNDLKSTFTNGGVGASKALGLFEKQSKAMLLGRRV